MPTEQGGEAIFEGPDLNVGPSVIISFCLTIYPIENAKQSFVHEFDRPRSRPRPDGLSLYYSGDRFEPFLWTFQFEKLR